MADTTDIEQRLSRCFQVVFRDLPAAEIPRASMAALAAWDSNATVTLLSLVEDEFGIDLGDDEEAAEELVSFELFVDYLAHRSDAR